MSPSAFTASHSNRSPTPLVTSPTSSSSSDSRGSGHKRRAEEQLTRCGKRKPMESNIFASKGCYLARAFEAWASPNLILTEGVENARLRPSELEAIDDPSISRAVDAVKTLFGVDTPLYNEIVEANADEFEYIVDNMRVGQRGARSADTNFLKKHILEYVDFSSGVRPCDGQKELRGFANDTIAKLLAPVEAGPLTPEYQALLHAGTAKVTNRKGITRTVDGRHNRVFAYEHGLFDPQNPLKGFLKGELIVKAYKAIFTSPSSVYNLATVDCSRSTRKGNADRSGMMQVTPGSLAYITTQVFFALSSKGIFDPSSSPEILQMYDSILKMFSSNIPSVKRYTTELLRWWNRTVFPRSAAAADPHDQGSLADIEDFYRDCDDADIDFD